METLLWHFRTTGAVEVLAPLWRPLAVGLLLYYSSYLSILVRALARHAGLARPFEPLAPRERRTALIVMPTLLRKVAELDGLRRAIRSVLDNRYPGGLVVCAAIDDSSVAPDLCDELESWVARLELPANTRVLVARRPRRGGKAMAIDTAVALVRAEVAAGALPGMPDVFFNMDADSELSRGALERMVATLTRPGRWSRQRPMIVTSNVCIPRDAYWRGWRQMFTVRGQVSLQVARELMTSVSLARHNSRLVPVSSVSGALYCTWTELYEQGPRYAAFVRTLRLRHWLGWWLGAPPPSFRRCDAEPLPEAMTGPADDTWVAWLAMSARWTRGQLDLELPRTPLHAMWYAVRGYFVRAVAYDSAAQIYTATPTTVRGLFKQRVRWNSSRIWLLNRFGWSLWFHWAAGAAVYIDVLIVVGLHAAIVLGLLVWPLADQPASWLALLLVVNLSYALVRGCATVLAVLQDPHPAGQWRKLLALPLSGPYHVVFNIATTVVGLLKDVFGFGVNTGFAPEETLVRAGTGRIALAFRVRRAVWLAVYAVRYGGVPFGRFWFGWHETRWTPNGYRGWTDPTQQAPPARIPRRRRAVARARARVSSRRRVPEVVGGPTRA